MNFIFTEQELNIILNALQELPFKVSAGVITSISNQIQANQPKQNPVVAEPEKESKPNKKD